MSHIVFFFLIKGSKNFLSVQFRVPCLTWPAINLNGVAYRAHVLIAIPGTLHIIAEQSNTDVVSSRWGPVPCPCPCLVRRPSSFDLPLFFSSAGNLTLIYRLVTFCKPKPETRANPNRNRSEPKVYANLANVSMSWVSFEF